MKTPFVVSEDICCLLQSWSQSTGFTVPQNGFLTNLRLEMREILEKMFGENNVEFVSADELITGLNALAIKISDPIISLDRSYFIGQYHLEMNRAVDPALATWGEVARFNSKPIKAQIAEFRNLGLNQVVLLDDVIFSGEGLARLIGQFKQAGIEVVMVIAGIVIGQGQQTLSNLGIPVRQVRYFAEVIDEICERDFYPGIPLCGRFVVGSKIETGAPYLLPFGKPTEWASIPESDAESFSNFCLKQTIRLWQEVENLSGKIVRCRDLTRLPIGLPADDSSFVDQLSALV